MTVFTRSQYWSFICTALVGLTICSKLTVIGSCVTEKKLQAVSTPTMEHFADSYVRRNTTSGESGSCRWILKSPGKNFFVQLTFDSFALKNSTKLDKGDCLKIFDGDDDDDDSVLSDILCDKLPQKSYRSTSQYMLIIYDRGTVEGFRNFSMRYSSISELSTTTPSPGTRTLQPRTTPRSHRSPRPQKLSTRYQTSSPRPEKFSSQPHISSTTHTLSTSQTSSRGARVPSSSSSSSQLTISSSGMSTEQIIKIVGVVGALLTAVGVAIMVLKVTKCCLCLRNKSNNGSSRTGSSSRERVSLARGLEQDRGHDGNIENNMNNQEDIAQPLSLQPRSNATLSTAANPADEAASDDAHDSDTESLQEMNELPPSYESLYLNELGEPVSPPKYCPPAHRSGHPPRRVNTFN